MTQTAVASDIHQTLDVQLHFGAQLTFDRVLVFNYSADLTGLLVTPV